MSDDVYRLNLTSNMTLTAQRKFHSESIILFVVLFALFSLLLWSGSVFILKKNDLRVNFKV